MDEFGGSAGGGRPEITGFQEQRFEGAQPRVQGTTRTRCPSANHTSVVGSRAGSPDGFGSLTHSIADQSVAIPFCNPSLADQLRHVSGDLALVSRMVGIEPGEARGIKGDFVSGDHTERLPG